MLRDALDVLAVHGSRRSLVNFAIAPENILDPRLARKPCQNARLDRGVVRHDKAFIRAQRSYAVAQDSGERIIRAVAGPKGKLGLSPVEVGRRGVLGDAANLRNEGLFQGSPWQVLRLKATPNVAPGMRAAPDQNAMAMAVFCEHAQDSPVFLARRSAGHFPKPEKFRDRRALIAHHGICKRLIDRRRREAIQGPALCACPGAKRRGRSQRSAARDLVAPLFRVSLDLPIETARALDFDGVDGHAEILDLAIEKPLISQILVRE